LVSASLIAGLIPKGGDRRIKKKKIETNARLDSEPGTPPLPQLRASGNLAILLRSRYRPGEKVQPKNGRKKGKDGLWTQAGGDAGLALLELALPSQEANREIDRANPVYFQRGGKKNFKSQDCRFQGTKERGKTSRDQLIAKKCQKSAMRRGGRRKDYVRVTRAVRFEGEEKSDAG